jgi:hypothetical protein
LDPEGLPTNLGEEDLQRIRHVLQEAYAPSTRSTYGTGLLTFHLFCDLRNIEERHRAPIDPTVLASFISALVGIYGGSSIKNFTYGIRAWHIIHGVQWNIDNNQLQALLVAGNRLAPSSSKKEERKPWTVDYLSLICLNLDPKKYKDAAIHACLTTAFWGTARMGEVTVPKLEAFDPKIHVKVSDVQFGVRDRNNLEETVIFLPWTKSAREKGKKIFWAKQDGITDPQAALANHLEINDPPNNGHLFAFKHKNTMRPMTISILTTRINQIIKANKMEKIPCHGVCISSTLE